MSRLLDRAADALARDAQWEVTLVSQAAPIGPFASEQEAQAVAEKFRAEGKSAGWSRVDPNAEQAYRRHLGGFPSHYKGRDDERELAKLKRRRKELLEEKRTNRNMGLSSTINRELAEVERQIEEAR